MFLEANACWRPDSGHSALTVVSGHLWATRPGSTDFFFGPGDTADLRGRGWLVQAVGSEHCEFILDSKGVPSLQVSTSQVIADGRSEVAALV